MTKTRQYNRQDGVFLFTQQQIDRLTAMNRIGTARTYTATLNSFMRFRNGKDLRFRAIDREMIEDYEASLLRSGLMRNTSSFYLRTFKTIYNTAVRMRLTTDKDVFKNVYTGFDKTCKRAIPISSIREIKRLDLSAMPSLAFARDMFIFSFYMRGMAFVDIAYLRKSDLRNGSVTYSRRKTGKSLTIEWEPQMQDIVSRYADKTAGTPYILPIIINKDGSGSERHQYELMERNINRNLKKIAGMVRLPVPLTMYVARHSWASSARSLNIPLPVISEGMGHGSDKTTQIYLASLDTAMIDKANKKILRCLL